jgi:ribosomal protein L16/L10AE
MGKGKGSYQIISGYVDYYATWVARGKIIYEIANARPEIAKRALKVMVILIYR